MMVVVSISILAGCSTEADRMAKCEAQGIDKPTCYLAEQNRTTAINAAAEKQALENAANAVQHAQAAHVIDPMREATLTGPGVKATVSNGFFKATINNKKAKVKRLNANYYEISGAGYIVSISLDKEGIQSASYTKQYSKTNGIMQVQQ